MSFRIASRWAIRHVDVDRRHAPLVRLVVVQRRWFSCRAGTRRSLHADPQGPGFVSASLNSAPMPGCPATRHPARPV